VRKLIVCGAGFVAALVLTVPGAFGGATQTPGVTARSITVGGLFPLTGPAATYAPIPLGMKAYFAYVNARRAARAEDPQRRRGVNGRQIVFKYYDHAYNPATAAQLARRLVEQDKVFATVGDLGTEPVLATRAYMNQQRVPQALVSTGATEFSTQYKEYPWTTGWQPDYIAEGRLYGLHVKANFNGKKIAIVYQNDAYGKDYLYGFLAALGKQYADANVVGTAKALGINPEQIYMNSVANVKPVMDGMVAALGAPYINGIITVTYGKDPQDPKWNNDPGMKLYRSIIAKYGGGANPNDPQVAYGVSKAWTFVQLLYRSGKTPTRAGLMNALTSMNYSQPLLLPGMVQKTSRTDRFILSQMQLQRFNGSTRLWVPFGQLIEARPR